MKALQTGLAQCLTLALTLPLLLASTPAQALPCWKSDEISAARVRQFEVMVMIVSLRCRTSGFDITDSYEQFRTAQRKAIMANEAVLRGHFGADKSKAGKIEYERYMTGIGNHYGSGKSDQSSCRMFGMVADALSRPDSEDTMASFAMEMIRDPILDSPRCPKAAAAGK